MPAQRPAQPRLDPRRPLVLDTRELGRRPGSMRPVQRTVSAPAGIGVELIRVPGGSDIELDLRLESVLEGVLVSGIVAVELTGECGRCLDEFTDDLEVDVQELFVYEASTSAETTDDDEVARMSGVLLDLEPTVRDAVVLALPLTPLCADDCAGLCSTCGDRLADLPVGHAHELIDPRWAALAGALDAQSDAADHSG